MVELEGNDASNSKAAEDLLNNDEGDLAGKDDFTSESNRLDLEHELPITSSRNAKW